MSHRQLLKAGVHCPGRLRRDGHACLLSCYDVMDKARDAMAAVQWSSSRGLGSALYRLYKLTAAVWDIRHLSGTPHGRTFKRPLCHPGEAGLGEGESDGECIGSDAHAFHESSRG